MNIIQLIGFSLEDDQSGRFLFVKLQTLAGTESGRTGLNLDGSVRQSGRSIVVSGQTTTVSRWRLRESSLTVTHDRLSQDSLA